MNDLNSLLIQGKVFGEPILKETKNGTFVCNFIIEYNRYYKQKNERINEKSFFDVETWGKLSLNCNENLYNDKEIRIVGRIKENRWNDSTGILQTKVKIIAEHIEFKSG
jgi:single-strand DNA-binding protein